MTATSGWLREERLTHSIIKAFYTVYNKLGYGFLENVYRLAMERELRKLGIDYGREVSVWIHYDGEELTQYRLDFIVEGKVAIEIKSTKHLPRSTFRQTYNYLRATTIEIGMVLHFGPEAKFYRMYCPNTRAGSDE